MLVDSFGRKITYLRISVTDRCNLRCVYCMPAEGIQRLSHEAIMRYEEIEAFVRCAAQAGVREVRITGGEPLARKDLPVLVEKLSKIPGIQEVSMTTNGQLLEKAAPALARAGLKRVNISLDTLRAEKFKRVTRGGSIERVWRGIQAAENHGLTPIKINMVVIRGFNDDEILDLARLTLDHDWQVRFIELMPMQNQYPWGEGFPKPEDAFVSVNEIMAKLQPSGLEKVAKQDGNGPAAAYRLQNSIGKLGFISPLSEHQFCQGCNRLRLTADGCLRPCLMSDLEFPLLAAMRAGQPILPVLQAAVQNKPSGHQLAKNQPPDDRFMAQIGG